MDIKKTKILLVDDSSFDRTIIEKRLVNLEFDVHAVSSGKEALKQILKSPFDIILLDYVMEVMNGIETLKEIRKMFGVNDLPAIILTSSNDEEVLVQAFESGANDYLVKPVNFQAMIARIQGLLAMKRASAEIHADRLKAEEANRAKSRFLFMMTKEMQIPINSVLGMTNMLVAGEITNDQKRYLELIQKSGDSLLSLISDINEISQLEGNEVEIVEENFNVNDTILDCFEFVMETIQKKGVDLIYYLDRNISPFLLGDVKRLSKIIIHLLVNAAKFTDEGEIFLHISPSAVQDRIIISLSDTGKGMSSDELAVIFDQFVHDSSAVSKQFGAYGLGLSLCKKNIELMDGEIVVESNVGKGTTFYLEIPFKVSHIKEDSNLKLFQTEKLKGLKILIIDDNETTLHILTEILESWGVSVKVANSGEKGILEILKTNKIQQYYDLILVDAIMPRHDGFNVIGRINRTFSLPSQVVLMLNSLPDFAEDHLCKTLGINFTIVKPILDSNLLTVITDVLRKQESIERFKAIQDDGSQEYFGNLLVVDDMQDVIDGMIDQFKTLPVRLFTTTDCLEALSIIQDQNIDLVLIDYKMSKLNGDELIAQCRDLNLKTKFILTSGDFSEDDMLELGKESNILAIENPFPVDSLLDLITKAMKTKKAA